MTEQIDCVVIGAGVIGLAVARSMAIAGRDVVILEAADAIGTGTSSRNSEVIHAGIYYPEGSLKAHLCVQGRQKLYTFCDSHGVTAAKTTKLVFAEDESQIDSLIELQTHAGKNGVQLEWLDENQASRLEPKLRCAAALLSPETGIVDSHGLMLALQGDAEDHGATIAFKSPVNGGAQSATGLALRVGGSDPMTLNANVVINCAGLCAQNVSRSIEGTDHNQVPPLHYAKGSYFYLSGKPPFSRLIYPLPGLSSLRLHYTLDLSGQARFGPDLEWTDTLSFDVDPSREDLFYSAVRKYWPGLPDGALRPGYAGIRPKIQAEGEPAQDFVIQSPRQTGVLGYWALYGIESPGLTSSIAIADYVAEKVDR